MGPCRVALVAVSFAACTPEPSVRPSDSAPPQHAVAPAPPSSPSEEPTPRPCAVTPVHEPLAFAEEHVRSGAFARSVPRFTTSEPRLAPSVKKLQATLDATIVRCPQGELGYGLPCTAEHIDCVVARNDGNVVSVFCHATAALENRARTYTRYWGLDFLREGDRFRPLALEDLARDGDAHALREALVLPEADAGAGTFFVVGNDELVGGGQDGAMLWVQPRGTPVSELREGLACDDALVLLDGAPDAPLAHAVSFGGADIAPVFRGAVADALNADVGAWLRQRELGTDAECRVTTSRSSIASVLCTTHPLDDTAAWPHLLDGAGFTYRLADGKRLAARDVFGRLANAPNMVAQRCFAGELARGEVRVAPPVDWPELEAFALEATGVVVLLPYERTGDVSREKTCRLSYGALGIDPRSLERPSPR
jgi:hypothetical protein